MSSENKREAYKQALITVQELILLGERHIPTGPYGAYNILDNISAYVLSLELEVVKMRAAIIRRENELAIPPAPQPGGKEHQAQLNDFEKMRKHLEDQKAAAFRNKTLNDIYESGREAAQRFPKVTL